MKIFHFLTVGILFLLVVSPFASVFAQTPRTTITTSADSRSRDQRARDGESRTGDRMPPSRDRSGERSGERELRNPVELMTARLVLYEEYIVKIQERIDILAENGGNVSEATGLLAQAKTKLAQLKASVASLPPLPPPGSENREAREAMRMDLSELREQFRSLHEFLKSILKSLRSSHMALPAGARDEAGRQRGGTDRTGRTDRQGTNRDSGRTR